MFGILFRSFPLNTEFNGLFKKTFTERFYDVRSSGNSGCWDPSQKRDFLSSPLNCIDPNCTLEWCSNINKSKDDKPWISISFSTGFFKMSGYSLQAGCCDISWCCCRLNSWNMEGSNDNKTWVVLHSQEENKEFNDCKNATFEVTKQQNFKFFRLIQTNPSQNCWFCIDLTRMEFYGDFSGQLQYDEEFISDEDEVSIIGRVSKST